MPSECHSRWCKISNRAVEQVSTAPFRQVFRELGLHVTVFPSLHASLFESYYVSLPNDGPALDQVKAAAARLAGRWHSLALGYTPKELAWHVEQRDRQHRGRIADVGPRASHVFVG